MLPLPKFLIKLSVFLLEFILANRGDETGKKKKGGGGSVLELVGLTLPGSVTLNPNANTTEDHFLSAAKIDAELYNVPILNGV